MVLAAIAVGTCTAIGSRDALWGTGIMGGALLAAALARLALPPRFAGMLATRSKIIDVLTFTVLGTGTLALSLLLP